MSNVAVERPPEAEADSFSSHLQEGEIFAKNYRIEGVLGLGGTSNVYRVIQLDSDRAFALKVIPLERKRDKDEIKRFLFEAETLHRLQHPNIVRVFEFGVISGGTPYQILELVEGETLASFLKDSDPLKVADKLSVAIQICSGLAEAHENGVFHRDIKPGNVIVQQVENSMHVRLIDFGIARAQVAKGGSDSKDRIIIGSPAYMSPEQALGEAADALSDIYSVGVLLYELFSGTLPFVGGSAVEQLLVRLHQPAPAGPLTCTVSLELTNIILRCLERDPSDRYDSAKGLRHDLERIAAGSRVAGSSS